MTTLRLLGTALVLALAIMGGTSSAAAGLTCPGEKTVQPFTPWLDPANYVLVQNGSLEATTGWALSGGAKLVSGNEPWKVNRGTDKKSLYLPSGSSATSPALCITLLHPTLRFFATNSGPATTTLLVEAITDVAGVKAVTPIGLVAAGAWQPTIPLAFLTNLLAPVSGAVQFRFTPVGLGSGFRIDDVYVDPYKHR